MSTEVGIRNVGFEVNDLDTALEAQAGHGLVGGVGSYENVWRMAHVRGPEGIVVALVQQISD